MPDSRPPQSSIILYQTENGRTRIECRFEGETIWLTQKLMAELFQKDVRTINEHMQNVFTEGELAEESVIRKFRITANDGKSYETQHYSRRARPTRSAPLLARPDGPLRRRPHCAARTGFAHAKSSSAS